VTLKQLQRDFLTEVSGDDDVPASSTGMTIYRNAYRGRLIGALESSFERTRRWVGDEAFAAAAAHYVLTHPPTGWTLDEFGADFPETLAELFTDDPEVAELAWLEWHMQQAFAAPDLAELTAAALAEAELGESDWAELRFGMAAGYKTRPVRSDLAPLWRSLASADQPSPNLAPLMAQRLVVWRQDLQPHFRLLDEAEFSVLHRLALGETFGRAAEAVADHPEAAGLLGTWLAQWLTEGLFSGFSCPSPPPASSR
jgi:Putative DNA-binding domain